MVQSSVRDTQTAVLKNNPFREIQHTVVAVNICGFGKSILADLLSFRM